MYKKSEGQFKSDLKVPLATLYIFEIYLEIHLLLTCFLSLTVVIYVQPLNKEFVTLSTQHQDIFPAYLNFSQRLSTFINVYFC